MNFKNKYKSDLNKITYSADSLNEVLKHKGDERTSGGVMRRLTPVILCVAILFTAVFSGIYQMQRGGGHDYTPDQVKNNNSLVPLKPVTSYLSLFDKINGAYKNIGRYQYDVVLESSIGAPATDSESKGGASKDDFSDTNNQVKGVQEADIVKTDGEYIYITNKGGYGYYGGGIAVDDVAYPDGYPEKKAPVDSVYILSANDGNVEKVSVIKPRMTEGQYYAVSEILLYGDTLVLVKTGYMKTAKPAEESGSYRYNYDINITAVEIYDITDRSNPVFVNELFQSGSYSSSRMVDNYLYLASTFYTQSPDEAYPETYAPLASSYNKKTFVSESNIQMAENFAYPYYTVLTGIDLTKPQSHTSSEAVLGVTGQIYSNGKNIYIAAYDYSNYFLGWGWGWRSSFVDGDINDTNSEVYEVGEKIRLVSKTNIYRFATEKGVVDFKASGTVEGTLLNQFSMDEYDGAFRIATTVSEYTYEVSAISKDASNSDVPVFSNGKTATYSNLYILGLDLKPLGSVEKMGMDERIYSVRFDGDIGYMVTFRQTDPLFAVDLSDKTNPRILSELKIPGFSNYMHSWNDNLLFGLGMDADNNGITTGLKLSMFDVTDKTNVTEKSITKLGFGYSEAQYQHKAIIVDSEKNFIGFPGYSYNENYSSVKRMYYVYSYVDGEFVQRAAIDIFSDTENYYYNEMRGLYIGDHVYIIAVNQGIFSYDMNDYERTDSFIFD